MSWFLYSTYFLPELRCPGIILCQGMEYGALKHFELFYKNLSRIGVEAPEYQATFYYWWTKLGDKAVISLPVPLSCGLLYVFAPMTQVFKHLKKNWYIIFKTFKVIVVKFWSKLLPYYIDPAVMFRIRIYEILQILFIYTIKFHMQFNFNSPVNNNVMCSKEHAKINQLIAAKLCIYIS